MICIGVNYKKVPLDIRARYAFSGEERQEFQQQLKEQCGCEGSVILSTCNRSEIYACGDKEDALAERIEELLCAGRGLARRELLQQIYVYQGEQALRHLFHVTSGLDSMVLGEDEILHQVKDSYQAALLSEMSCNEINIAFQGAMGGAKSVKTETLLSRTSVSVGTLAANRIETFLKEQGGSRVLLIGITGKIGGILAKNLIAKGITDIVGTSRSPVGGVSYVERYRYLDGADVIVSATSSPHYTLLAEDVAGAITTEKERLFVDLAVPRDIDRRVAEISRCRLVDVDDFQREAKENGERKLAETDKARLILEEKLAETEKSIALSAFLEAHGESFAVLKERSFGSVFYQVRDELDGESFAALLAALSRINRQE